MDQEKNHFLNLAGEYGVCAELAKRQIHSSLTYGNQKAADVVAFNKETKKYLVIEVKTTVKNNFVTGFFQKYKTAETQHPDLWVLVRIDKDKSSHFYILTHKEIAEKQMIRNKMTKWEAVKGVDNILLSQIEEFENKWEKINNALLK